MAGGQSTNSPPLRYNDGGREHLGARVFTQEQFGRLQGEPENLPGVYTNRGESLLGEFDPSGRDGLFRERREVGGLLQRGDLSPGGLGNGRESFLGGEYELDRRNGNRTVDYSRVAMNRPQADFRQQGMQQVGDRDLGADSVFDRNPGRVTPPWARGTNPSGSQGGLASGNLGAGVLGSGGLGAGGLASGGLGAGGLGAGGLGAGGLGNGGLGLVSGIGSTVITAKMTIARSMVGPVIGRKGANVQQIRQLSGAAIKV
jgi:hypothetical protein